MACLPKALPDAPLKLEPRQGVLWWDGGLQLEFAQLSGGDQLERTRSQKENRNSAGKISV